MISAFSKALAQMPEKAFRRVMWLSVGLTLLVFIGVILLANYVVLPMIAVFDWGWLNWLAEAAGIGVVLIALFVLFPSIATFFVCFFLDSIAEAVENRHFPADSPGRDVPLMQALGQSLRLVIVVVLLNILCLPLYLIPGLNLFVFYALNGYLLSREYFELVSIRHMTPSEASVLRRRAGLTVFVTGVVIAFLLTVPVVNLVAPVFATAMMVHVFKQAQRRHGEVRAG